MNTGAKHVNLNGMPWHTYSHLGAVYCSESTVSTSMFLRDGRKPKNPGETHTDMGRTRAVTKLDRSGDPGAVRLFEHFCTYLFVLLCFSSQIAVRDAFLLTRVVKLYSLFKKIFLKKKVVS